MKANSYVSADKIRSDFSAIMSAMYRDEVPAYGTLMALVAKVNDETLAADPHLKARLDALEGKVAAKAKKAKDSPDEGVA